MVENVINSRSITTILNQTIFDDKSTSIQFYGKWRSPWANTMNNIGSMVHQNLYTILEAGSIF